MTIEDIQKEIAKVEAELALAEIRSFQLVSALETRERIRQEALQAERDSLGLFTSTGKYLGNS